MDSEVKIGTACNNNCKFCLNETRGISASTEHIKEQINLLAIAGVDKIHFTGGEATIRKDFFEIIRHAKNNGLSVSIQSNGRAFAYPACASKTVSMSIESFLISLHADSEELNRNITNVSGGFEQTVRGIKNLRGLGQKIIINTVVSSLNSERIKDIIKHHCTLCPAALQISWTRPMGRAKENSGLIPKYTDYLPQALEALDYAQQSGQRISTIGIPPCLLGRHENKCARPYEYSATISRGMLIPAEKAFNDERKKLLGVCKCCEKQNMCGGPFKEYVEKYGESEFIEAMTDPQIIKASSDALGKEISKIEKNTKGFSSTNLVVSDTLGERYFIKIHQTDNNESLEKELKRTMKSAGVYFLDTITAFKHDGKLVEVYPFIENAQRKQSEITVKDIHKIANIIGMVHKESARVETQENLVDKLINYALNCDFLEKDEKEKILQTRERTDSTKKHLKASTIHNDLHIGNMLFQDENILITDFEKTNESYIAWDAAKAICSLCIGENGEIAREKIQEFLSEYKKFVSKEDFDALYDFCIISLINGVTTSQKCKGYNKNKVTDAYKKQLKSLLRTGQEEFKKI